MSIHSSVDERLDWFCILATVWIVLNKHGSINVCLTYWFHYHWLYIYKIPRSGIAGSYGSSTFNFLRNPYTSLHNGYTNLHCHKQHASVLFSLQPHWYFLFFGLFDNSHSNRNMSHSFHSDPMCKRQHGNCKCNLSSFLTDQWFLNLSIPLKLKISGLSLIWVLNSAGQLFLWGE
jgi:hypothetical protein